MRFLNFTQAKHSKKHLTQHKFSSGPLALTSGYMTPAWNAITRSASKNQYLENPVAVQNDKKKNWSNLSNDTLKNCRLLSDEAKSDHKPHLLLNGKNATSQVRVLYSTIQSLESMSNNIDEQKKVLESHLESSEIE